MKIKADQIGEKFTYLNEYGEEVILCHILSSHCQKKYGKKFLGYIIDKDGTFKTRSYSFDGKNRTDRSPSKEDICGLKGVFNLNYIKWKNRNIPIPIPYNKDIVENYGYVNVVLPDLEIIKVYNNPDLIKQNGFFLDSEKVEIWRDYLIDRVEEFKKELVLSSMADKNLTSGDL